MFRPGRNTLHTCKCTWLRKSQSSSPLLVSRNARTHEFSEIPLRLPQLGLPHLCAPTAQSRTLALRMETATAAATEMYLERRANAAAAHSSSFKSDRVPTDVAERCSHHGSIQCNPGEAQLPRYRRQPHGCVQLWFVHDRAQVWRYDVVRTPRSRAPWTPALIP